MIVTLIEPVDSKKSKIYLDGEYAFMLYASEIRRYSIREQEKINPDVLQEVKEGIYKRAKLKTMDLLKRSDRTVAELRNKLKTSGFREDAIEVAISYVDNYGYIDDYRYASNYIRLKKSVKSKRALQYDLANKGVEKQIIDRCMEEEFSHEDEEEAVKKMILKKTNCPKDLPPEKKQKIIASICRKGFSYEVIRRIWKDFE